LALLQLASFIHYSFFFAHESPAKARSRFSFQNPLCFSVFWLFFLFFEKERGNGGKEGSET
jgi:hypothetical protein